MADKLRVSYKTNSRCTTKKKVCQAGKGCVLSSGALLLKSYNTTQERISIREEQCRQLYSDVRVTCRIRWCATAAATTATSLENASNTGGNLHRVAIDDSRIFPDNKPQDSEENTRHTCNDEQNMVNLPSPAAIEAVRQAQSRDEEQEPSASAARVQKAEVDGQWRPDAELGDDKEQAEDTTGRLARCSTCART